MDTVDIQGLNFISRNGLPCNVYCVFPENIHTPTTEGISYRTPPPLRIFHFGVAVVAPPPLWNFQRIFYHPLYPLEIYFFLVANNKQEGRVILSRVYSRDGVHAQGKRR